MLGLPGASTCTNSAVANWRRLYLRQWRIRKLRRFSVVLVGFCQTTRDLRWGPAAGKDPLSFSTRDRLVAFAVEAVKGVLRSQRFRNWCVESIVEFCRNPVAKCSKLISAYYLAGVFYRWVSASVASLIRPLIAQCDL